MASRVKPKRRYASGGLVEMPDAPRFAAGPKISSDSIGKGILGGAAIGMELGKAYNEASAKAEKKSGSGVEKRESKDEIVGTYARGGKIQRTSGPRIGKDDGLIAAQKGEYVVRKSAVKALGTKALNTINKGKLPARKGAR